MGTVVESKRDSWTRSYRLSHCEGYAVHSPRGRVGYVEEVFPPPELGDPETLSVRVGRCGEYALALLPIDRVCEVLPKDERIVVDHLPPETGDSERSTDVADTKAKSRARRGDVVVIHGHTVGKPERTGEILEVLGEPGHEHYRVRWEDEHESLVYPSSDTSIRPAKR
jgi:hypothetical protein